MKHKNLQETGRASQIKHLQKSKLLSFIHSLSWSEKQCDFSPPLPRAASKYPFLLSVLNPWKNKSHPCWVACKNTGIASEVHNVRWQQKWDGNRSPQLSRESHQRQGQVHRSSHLGCAMMLNIILNIQWSLLLMEDCSSLCSRLGLSHNQLSWGDKLVSVRVSHILHREEHGNLKGFSPELQGKSQVDPANAFTRISQEAWQWACSVLFLSWHWVCSLFGFYFWKSSPKRPGQVSLILFPPHIQHKTHEAGSLLRLQMVHRKIMQLVWSVNWIGTCWVPKAFTNPRKASGEPHNLSQVTQHICLMTRLT